MRFAPCCVPGALALAFVFTLSMPAAVAAGQVTPEWELRLRHEHVEDDAFARDADATTARLRAGLRFDFGHGWSGLLEGEGLIDAGDRHNNGANGETAYPAVIDPDGAELNQAWIGWKNAEFGATLGRQRIALDNHRWVGSVGWRQNEQTFDALSLEARPSDDWTLRYAWLDKVHRVFGDDARDPLARERDLSTHVLHAAYAHGRQRWAGYAYLHEDRDVPAASTATYGLRWTAKPVDADAPAWGWTAEYARQRDHADAHSGNRRGFAHDYWLLEPSLRAGGITWTLGWEHLDGNGRHALQTPLATLHAFNGWADKFLVTPPAGLDDLSLGAGGTLGKFAWVASWHDYRPDADRLVGRRYGTEFDASLSRPLWTGWTGLIKYADYRSHGYARDTRKLSVQVQWSR